MQPMSRMCSKMGRYVLQRNSVHLTSAHSLWLISKLRYHHNIWLSHLILLSAYTRKLFQCARRRGPTHNLMNPFNVLNQEVYLLFYMRYVFSQYNLSCSLLWPFYHFILQFLLFHTIITIYLFQSTNWALQITTYQMLPVRKIPI